MLHNSVSSPCTIGALGVFRQSKFSCTDVAGKGAVGVNANKKDCVAPPEMLTLSFRFPTGWFAAFVFQNSNVAGTALAGVTLQPTAGTDPTAITEANADATSPTFTERLPGSTAAASVTGESAAAGSET